MNRPRGKFITFEGIDGAGKSSHLQSVADFLRQRGVNVVTSREPGGTPLGETLRQLLLNESGRQLLPKALEVIDRVRDIEAATRSSQLAFDLHL
ncbi:MAG TPA: hypothetical protein PK981_09065, partial [Accumulibacter sp.]|nr:hypothetical protein [Accumulibacter sp.]